MAVTGSLCGQREMLRAVFPWAPPDSQTAYICGEAFYFTGFMGESIKFDRIWTG